MKLKVDKLSLDKLRKSNLLSFKWKNSLTRVNSKTMLIIFVGTIIASIFAIQFWPASAAADPPSMCNCVIFRLDDIQDFWISNVQREAMNQFIIRNQSLSLGVVMNHIGNDNNILSKVYEGTSKGLFEPVLHGWDHVSYSQYPFQYQKDTLQQANGKMVQLFGAESKIFIPPYNAFNNDTLNALNQLDIEIISSEFNLDTYPYFVADGSHITDQYGVSHLPQVVGFYDHSGGQSHKVSNQQILSLIDNAIPQYGYAVITLHPQDFRQIVNGVPTNLVNQTEINDLNALIDSILARNYSIKTFAAVSGIEQGTIVDMIPPTIIPPADKLVLSTGTLTPVSLGNAQVNDNLDPSPDIANDAPSGGFPVGNTDVTWTATDNSGNVAFATQHITVYTVADIIVPYSSVASPPRGTTAITGPATGVPVNLQGTSYDLSGNQTNYVIPATPASSVKDVKFSNIQLTTSAPATGTITVKQTLTLNSATTVTAGTPVQVGTPGAGLTLGTITVSIPSGSATSKIITTTIPFTADSQLGSASLGIIKIPLTLGASRTASISTYVNPKLEINAGSGVKIIEVRTNMTTSSYKPAIPVGPRDWSTWTMPLTIVKNTKNIENVQIIARATDYFGNQWWNNTSIVRVTFSGAGDVAPPSITPPANVMVQATGLLTPVSLGTPVVSDNVTPVASIVVTNNATAAGFHVGTSIVRWTATDLAGNSAFANQLVTVIDEGNPTIFAPPTAYAQVTGTFTQVQLGTAIANDEIDPSPIITNNAPAQGFPLGTSIVTWTATDHSGNFATANQTVVVADDSIAPSLTVPPNITLEATGTITHVALGNPTVSDNLDPSPTVDNNAPSDGESTAFPVGTTIVTWTATDHFGNSVSATQNVTVTDTTDPTIIPPYDKLVLANGLLTPVNPGVPQVSDLADPSLVITNDAPSSFPIGDTIVHWQVTDDSGNSANAIQKITITEKTVMLAFDDSYKSQYTNAIPIMDQFGYKATFYTVCNYINNGVDTMTWQELENLNKTGHDIQAHTMNHVDLNHLSTNGLAFEIGQIKLCLEDRGYHPTNFQAPFNSGEGNMTVINEIAQYYEMARVGNANTMYLHCDGYTTVSSQTDCRTFFPNGTMTYVNRYSMKMWSHNDIDIPSLNVTQRFDLFVQHMNMPTSNQNGQIIEFPLMAYHRIQNDTTDNTTPVELFEMEMQYLHDNNFVVLTMADVGYDTNTNYFFVKSKPLVDTIKPYILQPTDVGVVSTGSLTPVALVPPFYGDNVDPVSLISFSNTAPPSGYPIGTTTVTWKAKDTAGNYASVKQKVVVVSSPDTTDPTVAITSPASNATFVGLPTYVKVFVTGTSSDASGIKLVEVRTEAPSSMSYTPVTPRSPGDWSTWNATLTFQAPQGLETIVARATDLFGNVKTVTVNVNVVVDATAPVTTATPPGGTYNVGQSITLASDKPATIYYTTNGAVPTTMSPVYSSPISISSNTTLKFFAKDVLGNTESVKTQNYTFETVAPVTTANPLGGTYISSQLVTLSANEPATIYYTTNGTNPTTSSPVYSSPIPISITTTLKFFAKDTAGNSESVKTEAYTINIPDTSPPVTTASPPGGLYSSSQSVTLTANETATIYYTTNGTNPTTSSPVYSSPIPISITTTLKFFAKDTAGNSESVKSAVYNFDTTRPVITLNKNSPITIAQGSSYADGGAKAFDNVDGNITSSIVTTGLPINTSVVGTYFVNYNVHDAAGNAATQVSRTVNVVAFPIIHMQDQTPSSGLSTYSSRQIHAEFVSSSSSLVGDTIDTIVLRMKKAGSPTGTAQIGVFNSDLTVKRLFSTMDVSTLTTSYVDYTFALSSLENPYTIQSGDRIGIKYTASVTSANNVAVMRDSDASSPFDGTNSYHVYYDTTWRTFQNDDLYMILQQSNPTPSASDVSAPTTTASPAGGTYTSAQSVSLTANEQASIFYTTDGSTPTISSQIYSSPLSISSTTTLKFFARDIFGNSENVKTETYLLDLGAPTTTASPPGGSYNTSQSVTLSADEPATIYYTLDGSTPTTSSSVYSSAISITVNTTLKFFAKDTSGNSESVKTETYVIDTTAPITNASPLGGSYSVGQSVTLSADEPATIYYTLDGSTPTTSSSVYSLAIPMSVDTTLKFFAKDTAGNSESVKTEIYTISIPDTTAPVTTASPPGTSYSVAQSVTLTADEPATIYYTTDGSTPDELSTVYSSSISVSSNATLKFFAKDTVGNTESVKTEVYVIDSDIPFTTASPSGGSYTSAQSVSLTANEPATIYYTTNGVDPTTSSPVYSTPISISSNTTLKFFAKDTAGNTESVKTEIYVVDTTAPVTTASPLGGIFNVAQSVSLTANEPATIYYTTNGVDPTTSDSVYSTPISISSNTTLKFFAKDTLGNTETIKTQAYTIDTVHPVITLLGTSPLTIAQGSSYVDAGATAIDNISGVITGSIVKVNPVNTAVVGTYIVTYNVNDAAGNAATQVTRTVNVVAFPIVHMDDTVSSFGLSTYSGRQINAEYINTTSSLVGKQIDSITLKLKKTGTPTGTAEIGVFNADRTVKKLFGTKDVATLTGSYVSFTFTLGSNELYTIQAGDRIGIKFTGGNASNNPGVMTDQDVADPFDGQGSYYTAYTTSWSTSPKNLDMTMTLKQSHP